MKCEYCRMIHSTDIAYLSRLATRGLASDFPRCEWHWRFVCDICEKPRHFNGISWCETEKKFVCLGCGEEHRLVRKTFWRWDSYYAIRCPFCHELHPVLERLEYLGKHPWQLHPQMLASKTGLSTETEYAGPIVSTFLPNDRIITDKTVGEAWDSGAVVWWGRYNEFGDPNRRYIIDPALLSILGQVQGLRILDAGCGNGYLSWLLSEKGARMVGVDLSTKAIEMARAAELEKPKGIQYHVGSICDLSMFRDEIFDSVVSNIVLCDLQDLKKAIAEIHRVLKTKGRLVFSILHPCFTSPPVHGWVKRSSDSERAEDWQYWKVDRYFERGIEEYRYGEFPTLYGFHRPLSDYLKALIRNGFILTDFEEPVQKEKDIEEHQRQLNDGNRIAWFLVIGAMKTQPVSGT